MEGFVLSLQYSDEELPLLQNISTLFHDLELAHDFGALLASQERRGFAFSSTFWFRNGRPVPRSEKIRAARIVKESPLLLEVVIPGLTALWMLIHMLEKVYNMPLVREKLEREVSKLRRDDALNRNQISEMHAEFIRMMDSNPPARRIADNIETRLRRNPIQLISADLKSSLSAANDPDSGGAS